MKKLILGAAVVMAALLFAAPAALANPTGTGFLEICKYSDSSSPVSGVFHFTVDGNIAVAVNTGGCSAPFSVPAGTATVVEQSEPFYAETAASTIPQSALVSSNLATQTQEVTVTASSDVSTATTLNVTNKQVTGTLEICKSAVAGSGLTGTFTFKVTGPFGFSKTVSVPVGACSQSFTVPAGVVEVDEIGANDTDLVSVSAVPSGDLVTDNLAAGTTEVKVAPGTTDANETIETFVNDTSRLKICKVAAVASLNGTVYSFTAAGQTVQAVAEPAPGGCVQVQTPFPGGTHVDIQEGIVPGTAVTGISVSDNRAVPGSIDLANRKVSVALGSGETIVTYTNNVASPGLLKVCKNAGPGVTVGQTFHFTIGSQTLDVLAGYCAIAGSFPFNSTQTITEAPTAGLSVIGETDNPSSELVSADLASGVLKTLIGAGVTEATFTNATTGTPPSTSGTGSGTGSTTPAPTTIPTTSTTGTSTTPIPVVETPKPTPSNRCTVTTTIVFVRTATAAPTAGLGSVSGAPELVLRVHGDRQVCDVLLREFNGKGIVVASSRRHVKRGQVVRIRLSRKVQRVRATVVR